MARDRKETPEICPVCGADVPPDALACPDCGADHATGWNEEATRYDGWVLPEDDFDYDEYVKREFPDKYENAETLARKRKLAVIIGMVVVAIVALFYFYVFADNLP